MDHHVGELHLKVRTDVDAPERVRETAESFVRACIERCAELLEARRPGRIVLMDRWPLRLALDELQLDDAGEIEATAQAAADAIEAAAVALPADASDAPGPVAFDDEALWRASHLLAHARGRLAWFHAAIDQEPGDPLTSLSAPAQRPMALSVLRHLADAGALAEVLAAQSPVVVAVLAAAWDCDELPPAVPNARPAAQPSREAEALGAAMRSWPALPDTSRLLAMHVHAAALLGAESLREPRVGALVHAAQQAAVATGVDRTAVAAVLDATDPTADATCEPTLGGARTRLAGLFNLVALLQELGIAEALWQACLPEGELIAASWRTLVDLQHADDLAFENLGGISGSSLPEVNAEQLAEIAVAAVTALSAALPRRGLAERPPVIVSLADTPNGRMLLAAAEGAPFGFFAWPAQTPASLTEGLRAFLDAWSSNAVVSGSPALARLDTKGRVQPRLDAARKGLPLPSAASAPAAALLSIIAGAPATLLAARLDAWDEGDHVRFASAWFERDATLLRTAEGLLIHLSEDERDLPLRRAGLDRDPGWVPWLSRKLEFVFDPPLGGSTAVDSERDGTPS